MRRVRGKMLTALLKNNPEQAIALAKELSKDYKDILLINVLDILKTNKKLTPTDRLELYKDFF